MQAGHSQMLLKTTVDILSPSPSAVWASLLQRGHPVEILGEAGGAGVGVHLVACDTAYLTHYSASLPRLCVDYCV